MYGLVTLTPPASEPVSLELAKAHLRIDHDEENDLIRAWIAAARQLTESYTGRRWVSQSLRLTREGFPAGEPIRLPVEPVSAVTLLKYRDTDGTEITLAGGAYQTFLEHSPPLIAPLPDESWPDTEAGRLAAVTVEFTAGGGEIPEAVKAAILLTIGMWDENRGDQNRLIADGLPPGARRLLDLMWTGSYC